MDMMDEFFDDEKVELEGMREERKKLSTKDFGKLINKRDIGQHELDELFM